MVRCKIAVMRVARDEPQDVADRTLRQLQEQGHRIISVQVLFSANASRGCVAVTYEDDELPQLTAAAFRTVGEPTA